MKRAGTKKLKCGWGALSPKQNKKKGRKSSSLQEEPKEPNLHFWGGLCCREEMLAWHPIGFSMGGSCRVKMASEIYKCFMLIFSFFWSKRKEKKKEKREKKKERKKLLQHSWAQHSHLLCFVRALSASQQLCAGLAALHPAWPQRRSCCHRAPHSQMKTGTLPGRDVILQPVLRPGQSSRHWATMQRPVEMRTFRVH